MKKIAVLMLFIIVMSSLCACDDSYLINGSYVDYINGFWNFMYLFENGNMYYQMRGYEKVICGPIEKKTSNNYQVQYVIHVESSSDSFGNIDVYMTYVKNPQSIDINLSPRSYITFNYAVTEKMGTIKSGNISTKDYGTIFLGKTFYCTETIK